MPLEEWKGVLKEGDADRRLDAIRSLFGCSGGAETLKLRDPLVQMLQDADERVRLAAVLVLAHNNTRTPNTQSPSFNAKAEVRQQVPFVLQMLRSDDPERRELAQGAVAEIGPDAKNAVAMLMEDLNNRDRIVWHGAAHGLAALGEAAVEPLAQRLREGDKEIRQRVVFVFDRMEGRGRKALPVLEAMLKDKDKRLVLLASAGITAIDKSALYPMPQAEANLRLYIDALKSDDLLEQGYALISLACLGDKAVKAVPAMVEFGRGLEGQGAEREMLGLVVAGAVAGTGKQGVEELLKLVDESDEKTGILAADLLGNGRQSYAEFLPRVWKLADKKHGKLKGAIIDAIGSIGCDDEATMDRIATFLQDREVEVRRGAVRGLVTAEVETPEVLAALGRAQADSDPEVRQYATLALERIRSHRSTPESRSRASTRRAAPSPLRR